MVAAGSGAYSAARLAEACGGRVVGDATLSLTGVRALEAAGPSEISFVADGKESARATASRAGVLLARSAAPFEGRTVIEVPSPQLALGPVLRLFHPPRVARPGIHPTAILESGAEVHPAAEIGPFAVIGPRARIGAGCIVEAHTVVGEGCELAEGVWLHPHVVLYQGVQLGARAEVHSGAVLGADGFGYAESPQGILKIPQVGTVEIGADVEIGANTCVDRASLEVTRIGAGTKVDDLVMVGHNCQVGRHNFLCAQVGLAGSTITGDGVVLAGQVGVAGHLKVGNRVKVGAQSGLSTDIPDGEEVFGSPHMPFRDFARAHVEFRRLPETARLVRRLAKDIEKERGRG